LEQELEKAEVFDIGNYPNIAARPLQLGSTFNITGSSKLGHIPLQPYLEQPRSIDNQGLNRADIFIFCCSLLTRKRIKGSVLLLTDT
jgi:hypothetical protein